MHHGACMDDLSWVVDSGATDHISRDARFAKGIRKTSQSVLIANGQKVQAKGVGTVEMTIQVGSKKIDLCLSDVLIVPEAPYALLFVTAVIRKREWQGCGLAFGDQVICSGMHMGTAPVVDGLAGLKCAGTGGADDRKFAMLSGSSGSATSAVERAKLWYQRLGNVSIGAIQSMQENHMVKGWEKEPLGSDPRLLFVTHA